MKYDIIILGNDPIGIETAIAAAASNLRTAIVLSKPDGVLGCSEQLCDALSILVPELAVSRICGTGVFTPGSQFSMSDLRTELQAVIDDQRDIAIERLNESGVDMIVGDPHFVDEDTISVDGEQFSAKQIVVASGTRPGSTIFTDGENVTNAIQLLSMDRIPLSLAVVGGNRIGMQLGLLFAGIGSAVTIIDGRPLVHCGLETDVLIDRALELGVEFRLGSNMINVDIIDQQDRKGVSVHLENGERLAVEHTVLANPALGNSDGLSLQNAGLEADEKAQLWCNEQLQTWKSNVYAIGSIVGFPKMTDAAESLRTLTRSFSAESTIPRPMGLLRSQSRQRQKSRNA